MLRSCGWVLQRVHSHHVRFATTVTQGKLRTSKTKKASERETRSFDLSEVQASLEACGYKRKRGRKSTRETAVTTSKPSQRSPKIPAAGARDGNDKPVRRRSKKNAENVPARLSLPTAQRHHDLASFLQYVQRGGLSTKSNVYKGTHYEYMVANALQMFDFTLHRTGRSNDLGIDLVGKWKAPGGKLGLEMPVIVQCKCSKPSPSMVRELEGAYVGAPAGWRGDGVLALLVTAQAATKGVRAAIQRSRWPLGALLVSSEGVVKQFTWNAAAAEAGLEGMGVAARYASNKEQVEADAPRGASAVSHSITLTWMGQPWRPIAISQSV